jgi:hypothetical protein
MSVFDAMIKIKNYIEHCPTEDMKIAAKKDFIDAIREYIDVGYTWGRVHPLPFEISMLSSIPKNELLRLRKMLENA